MRLFIRSGGDQRGLTLVEMMASLTVFAIVSVGIVPLLASSIRGASLARSYTVGKNVAVKAMERARALPFMRSVSTTTTPRKIDLLDLYFPCAPTGTPSPECRPAGSDYIHTAAESTAANAPIGTYVTSCSAPPVTNPACPRNLPVGYLVRFDAQFVSANSGSPETYTVLTAATSPALSPSYNWSTTSTEIPPTKLLKFAITVSWPFSGGTESYQLDSLLSDRKFGIEKVNGVAKVDHAIRVFTTYLEPGLAGDRSVVTATGPSAASNVTSRLTALAEQSARGGEISLVREGTPTTAATPLINPALSGATSAYGAPPDQTSIPNPAAAAPAVVAKHPNLCQDPSLLVGSGCVLKQVAHLSDSHTTRMSVSTAEDRPNATGSALTNPVTLSMFDLFVDAQRNPAAQTNPASKNPLHLLFDTSYADPATIQNATLNVRPNANVANNDACVPQLTPPTQTGGSTASCRSMFASTSALTSALAPATSRKVETWAWTGFAELRIFPSSIIPGSEGASKPIVEITNFAARVSCTATGNPSTVLASASWSATLRYRKELNNNNGETKGSYQTVYLTSSNFQDEIKNLKDQNPMVYEVAEPGTLVFVPQQGDAYLFPKTTAVGIHPSYLSNLAGAAGQTTLDSVGGASATAQIPGALTLTTGPADPDVPQSAMNITLGALSCSAADRRT